jgi:hypothetical protein
MRPDSRPVLALLLIHVLALAWGVAAAAPAKPLKGPLRVYLPDDKAVPGWVRDGQPQEFEGEDLYTYIDGGAEIYEEYGFRRVIVQDYKDAAGQEVSLEIFEMETPEAAFGMFTFKRSGQGRALELGGGGELESYYLNFWKNRFLVTLTGFDDTAGTSAGLRALAGAVEARLSGESRAPAGIGLLPEEGLRPGSVKYLRGLLGLNNVYDLHTVRGLDFMEAVKGDYDDGSTLIVMCYTAWARWDAAKLELSKHLEQGGRFEGAGEGVYRDAKGRYISIAALPCWIAVGLGPDAETSRKRSGRPLGIAVGIGPDADTAVRRTPTADAR